MTTATVASVADVITAAFPYRSTNDLIADVSERFTNDVADHVLTVLHDDGVYRHLMFRSPTTSMGWFEVVTWPDRAIINGDMGTYVFSGVSDWFHFFRGKNINPHYWAQKLAPTGSGSAYSSDQVLSYLAGTIADWAEVNNVQASDRSLADMIDAVQRNIVPFVDDMSEVSSALADFDRDGLSFVDAWDWGFDEFTYHFLWSCHALVWAVTRYDEPQSRAN